MAAKAPPQLYPLYNTTFSLHRLSPLYTGSDTPLGNATLRDHARRFRDILAGEVLRGVRVGLGPEDDVLARVGALRTVTWRILPEEAAWNVDDDTEMGNNDTTIGLGGGRGMLVTITYEKIEYKAIMLRDNQQDMDWTVASARENGDGFESFPLLLLKMPGSLRETFLEFLAATFDVRVSTQHISSKYLIGALERYVADLSIAEDGEELEPLERAKILRDAVKETAVYVGFDIPGGSLKTVDIQIAREDLPRMVFVGQKIGQSPLFDALTSYAKAHLAMDLRHEKVKIVRIASGAFVLGGEGKIKITQPLAIDGGDSPQSRATRRLVDNLIEVALGGTLSSKAGT